MSDYHIDRSRVRVALNDTVRIMCLAGEPRESPKAL